MMSKMETKFEKGQNRNVEREAEKRRDQKPEMEFEKRQDLESRKENKSASGLTKLEKYWILYDVGNSAFVLLVATILPSILIIWQGREVCRRWMPWHTGGMRHRCLRCW